MTAEDSGSRCGNRVVFRPRDLAQNSGGNAAPANDCSGAYSFDFNAWIQSGADPLAVVGQEIDAQYWSRDPASPSTTGLTNALSFVIGS